MRSAEGSGRTVEEAIREALRILGARREDVDLIVLDEGSRGVLGIGAREARVRLTLLSEEEEEGAPERQAGPPDLVGGDGKEYVSVAQEVASELIDAMGIAGTVTASQDAGAIRISISGANLGPLIGRRGQTLEALELIVNLVVARRLGRRVPVLLDAERYRERRRQTLQALARRVAAKVRRTGRPVVLEPMPASERRIIHTVLAADAEVMTFSEGEGAERHVVVSPRGPVNSRGSRRGPVRRMLDSSLSTGSDDR